MARFTETVNIGQAPVIQTDTSALTNRLDAFANSQIQQHAQKVAATSFAEGRAALEEGVAPQFKEERFFGSVGSKAYNEGLRASYVSSIDRDNRQEIARIVAENPSDLSTFNDTVESYRKATLASVDPTARQVVSDSMDSLISANRIRVQTSEIEKNHRQSDIETSLHIETATSDALAFARNGDDISAGESALAAFATIDARVDAEFITGDEAAVQKREIEKGLIEEGLAGGLIRVFDDESPKAAYDALDDLSDKVPKGFSPDEWNSFIAKSQSELNRKLARQERNLKASAKEFKKELEFGFIEQRLAGDDSQIIDPKMADQYYIERVQPNLEGMSLEQKQASQAEYMDRLKVIPNTIKRQITNFANSNDPDLLQEGAMLIDRIDDIPGVVNQIPNTEQAYLQNVTNLLQNMEPSEAVDLARRSTDPKDTARIDVAKQVIKEMKKDEPGLFAEKSSDAFSSIFAFDPLIDDVSGAQMAKEYGNMWENFVTAGMSPSDAFDKTDKMIKRNWGETEALGVKRVMKYPPEQYYAIENDTSWIKDQLLVDMQDQVAGIKVDEFLLMSNKETARTASTGHPTYAVKGLIDGSFVNLGQWVPDKAAEIERLKAQNVREALEERKKKIQKRIEVDDLSEIGMAL